MENNKNKKRIFRFSVFLAIIIPVILSLSFAYFQAIITGEDAGVTSTSTDTFDIELITENDGYINAIDLLLITPEEVAEHSQKGYFKVVSGSNEHYVYYTLSLSEITISSNLQVDDFKWQLLKDNIEHSSGTFNGVSQNSMTLASNILIGANETANYELRLWIEETGVDQISLMNGSFVGKVSMVADMEQNLLPFLNNHIISLATNSLETGVYNENGYRYEGSNPNNYVSFNGEAWRIIGVFDEDTHGIAGENLVKIIREESIGNYKWDADYSSNWYTSSLKTYLNDEYYNSINSASKPLTENVWWHLGGQNTPYVPASTFYDAERGETVPSGHPKTDEGHIGLMYPSDYGYAIPEASCARDIILSNYYDNGCYDQNWLFLENGQWTITPIPSDSESVWYVCISGVTDSLVSSEYAVHPSLYLKSNTIIISGDGTSENSFVLGG